ncbi:MASE1 domain-containing protein [Erythrobacter sp. HKB08]|uniref:MASE1 domain-containing protein n=1 Tax=Erythrobacter sp. HKB08 TaxID=2502843 RepID=UPI0010090041|nr:MASE1 domain-containing protein [Erythrobacter sp. HKB08]
MHAINRPAGLSFPPLASLVQAAAVALAVGALFGVLAHLSIEFTRGSGRIAMVWIPNAIAVACLLRFSLRYEPMVLGAMWAGNFGANLLTGDPGWNALILSSANSLEIVASLFLARRFIGESPDMRRVGDLMRFVGLAGIIAPSISATFAMSGLGPSEGSLLLGWLKWMATDGLGMIIIAPTLMVFIDAARDPRLPSRQEVFEWLILTAMGTSLTFLVFVQSSFPLLFLVPLIVLVHAFRLGALGTAFSVLKVGVIAIACTWYGRGPMQLVDGSLQAQLVVLQAFLAASFATGFPVAALLWRQKETVRALEASEAQLTLLADNMSDALMRYDMDGVCTYASASVAEVLDQPVERFVGNTADDRVHPDEQERISKLQQRLLNAESERERLTYRRRIDDKDGEPVFIEANCALVRDSESGEPNSILVCYRDVTERVNLEQKLVRARRHAENAAVAKSQFLANMSHEIRTPMNGVLGFVDLLLASKLTAEQRRHAELLSESGRSMMLLLNDILDISKIEAGEIVISHEPVNLRHLVAGCISLQSARAEEKGITLSTSFEDELPEVILSDGLRLRQILLNLLGNAIKFTHEGAVRIVAEEAGGMLAVTVCDSGIGIAEDRLESIFNPFEQADNNVSRRYGGTGLGLSISRRLAQLLDGSLVASSTEGEGSRFRLEIPLLAAEAGENGLPDFPRHEETIELLGGSRVLLAEDHDINRILISTMLERCGLPADIVEDGQQAVGAIMSAKAQGEPYQLVLMDVQMPECDGYTATRTVRELGIGADELPIVALTANAYEDDIRAALDSGMQAHLAKPLQFKDLVATLQRWLRTRIVERAATPEETTPIEKQRTEGAEPTLEERWQMRRTEALEAVAAALRQDRLEGELAEELARTVHKLAGTAGMFGEDDLGEKAGALERALKADVSFKVRNRLAEELLDAA